MNPQAIGLIVKKYRKLASLTQNQLAELSGVGKTAVFDIEKGKDSIQLNTLLKVFEVLNIQISLNLPFVPKDNK